MAAFPAKGKNALLNAMQKLVDNYTVDRDIYIYGDRQKKIIYTLGGYVTKDTTGICWHNPFNLGEVMEDKPCKDHPDAPHGFDRNASHNADRYVCECENWEPKPVDHVYRIETNGRPCVAWDDASEIKVGAKLYAAPREWVGLTDEDMEVLFLNEDGVRFARYIEAKLKEKNT